LADGINLIPVIKITPDYLLHILQRICNKF